MLKTLITKFLRWNGRSDSADLVKPYCIACPQALMAIVYGAVAVGAVLFALIWNGSWALVVCCVVCIGAFCLLRPFRRITLGRELSTLVFLALSTFSIYRVCISDEPWDTTPHCEDDVPAWNGGGRKDPGGEKVAFSMLFVMFATAAAMPWLPAGNRYYRMLRDVRCRHSATGASNMEDGHAK